MDTADKYNYDFGNQRTGQSRPFLQDSDGNEAYFLQVFTYDVR